MRYERQQATEPRPVIIIPIRDRKGNLEVCIASIRRYFDGEVILVDDSSVESYEAICRTHHIKYYRLDPPAKEWRKCKALNLGISKTDAGLIMINDVDCAHVGNLMDDVLKIWRRHKNCIVLPTVWGTKELASAKMVETAKNNGLRQLAITLFSPAYYASAKDEWPLSIEAALGRTVGNVLIPRHIYDMVHGYDENFTGWGCDDNDFVYRAMQQGFSIIYTKQANMLHINHVRQTKNEANYRWFKCKLGMR